MITKLSLLVNTIFSFIFIGLVIFSLFENEALDTSGISAIIYILITYPAFLWLNYIYFKGSQAFYHNPVILPHQKTGRVMSVVVIVLAVLVFIFTLLALVPLFSNQSQIHSSQVIGYSLFVFFSLLSAITAIFNAVCYRKLVKQNKSIFNTVINTLGQNT